MEKTRYCYLTEAPFTLKGLNFVYNDRVGVVPIEHELLVRISSFPIQITI